MSLTRCNCTSGSGNYTCSGGKAVQRYGIAQQRYGAGNWLDCNNPASRTNSAAQQNRVISKVGADIGDRHPGLDIAQEEDRQPAFPIAIQHHMAAEAEIITG